jgi:hypothetical protein
VERTEADPLAQERVYRSGAVNTATHLHEVAIIDLGGPEPGAFHDVYRKYSMRDRLIREHGTSANQVFWEGQTPLLGDVSFVDASISAMDAWLAAVHDDTRDVPLSQKIIDAKDTAGITDDTLDCQDTQGNVIFGGMPMGPAPVSVPYRPAVVDGPDDAAPPLPATGGEPHHHHGRQRHCGLPRGGPPDRMMAATAGDDHHDDHHTAEMYVQLGALVPRPTATGRPTRWNP